jgi:carbamoyltransferase
MYSEQLVDFFQQPSRLPGAELLACHRDIACSLQAVLEEVLLDGLVYAYRRTASGSLCMAGGVALNCVANGRLLRDGPFDRLFVQPAAGDAGACLGAAAIASMERDGPDARPERLADACLGPRYSSGEILKLLDATGMPFARYEEPALMTEVASRLARGELVGWFQGRMEFGPRALGARSILADPRNARMQDRINTAVKRRESFRPFAPAVLEERCASHFDLDDPSPFMLETCQVISSIDLPAITHIDGSARVQTVSAATHPRFAKLLTAFEQLTGCPILLNTSFNMKDEPIVCSPVDALVCFVRSEMDVLVLENTLIERSSLSREWEGRFRPHRPAPQSGITPSTYTFL